MAMCLTSPWQEISLTHSNLEFLCTHLDWLYCFWIHLKGFSIVSPSFCALPKWDTESRAEIRNLLEPQILQSWSFCTLFFLFSWWAFVIQIWAAWMAFVIWLVTQANGTVWSHGKRQAWTFGNMIEIRSAHTLFKRFYVSSIYLPHYVY